MKKKDTASQGASEWSSVPAARITPSDVQEKEFQVARFGAGYRMRDVDEFLDQVTDTLSALMAENERLLRGAGDTAPAASPPPMQPADDTERAAVDAFLRREKGFLQDLGALVQAHAEELRTMVRSARRDVTAPTADVAPEEEPRAGAPPAAPLVVPEARSDAETPPATTVSDAGAMEGSPEPTTEVADQERGAEAPTPDTTETVADEPIRLEEPEPARSSRRDDDEEGSLRELFWGEE
jgi:DivIVA domain-containing protein